MKTVILAGGKGLDLYPLTETRPKPMITLLGKPI
ncbi:MAG: sugar phosphate nucleotidyltransferase, partial [Candidatus Heimdallarchaeaceae archaeon]